MLASGWVTTGTESPAFESEFATYVGAAQAVAVSSCTAAIELALRSLRLAPRRAGADLDDDLLRRRPRHRARRTAAGARRRRPGDRDADAGDRGARGRGLRAPARRDGARALGRRPARPSVALAAAAGLPADRVVEDAAHGLGTCVGTGTASAPGPAVCFSFYATKNLPIGEGGMVTTDDPDRAAWIRRARLHGMSQDAWRRYLPGGSWRYDVAEAGLKANMSDLQAAIGRAQLRGARRSGRTAGPSSPPGTTRCWPAYPASGSRTVPTRRGPARLAPVRGAGRARAARATSVARGLAERAIGTSVHFIPVHRLSHFSALGATRRPARRRT